MASASDPALSEPLHMPAGLANVLTHFVPVPYDQQAELKLGMKRIVRDIDARQELLRDYKATWTADIEDLRAKIAAAEVQQKLAADTTEDCEKICAKLDEWMELVKQDRHKLPKCGQVKYKPAFMMTVAEVVINEMLRNPDPIHQADRLMSCYYLILAIKLIFKVVPGWNKSRDFMFIASSGCPSCKSKWCSPNAAEHSATCSHRNSGFLAAFSDDDAKPFVDETTLLLSEMPAEDDYGSIILGPIDGKRRPSRMGGGAAKRTCVSSN